MSASTLTAVAVQHPQWCEEDMFCGPGEVLHERSALGRWVGECGERLGVILDRQDDIGGTGDDCITVTVGGPAGPPRELVRMSRDDARGFFLAGLALIARSEAAA